MADRRLVRWRDVLWVIQRWLPLTERAAERGFLIAQRGAGRRAAARMRAFLGVSEDEARSLSRRFLVHSIRVTQLERRLRRSRSAAADLLQPLPLQIVGREHLDAARNAHRGALLVMVHRFAVRPVVRAMRTAGYPLVVVVYPHPHPMFGRLGHWIVRSSHRRLFHYFYPDHVSSEDPDVSVKIVKRLRAGDCVLIAADARKSSTTTVVPFLGGEATVSTGVLELARVSGSPILPFDALYGPDGLHAEIGAPLALERGRTRDEHLALNLPRLVAAMERRVEAAPDQWTHWVDL
jgi:lauroyl/myristoyl acyltransferase